MLNVSVPCRCPNNTIANQPCEGECLSLDKGKVVIRFVFNGIQGPKGHTSDSA